MKNIFLILGFFILVLSCSKDTEYIYLEKPKIKERTGNSVKVFFDRDSNIYEIGNLSKSVTSYEKNSEKSVEYKGYISKVEFLDGKVVLKELKDYKSKEMFINLDEKGRKILLISESFKLRVVVKIKDPNSIYDYYYINIDDFRNSDTLNVPSVTPNWILDVKNDVEHMYMTPFSKNIITYNDIAKTAIEVILYSDDGIVYEKAREIHFKLDEDGNIDYSEGSINYDISNKEILYSKQVVKRDNKGNVTLSYYYYMDRGRKIINMYNTYSYVYF